LKVDKKGLIVLKNNSDNEEQKESLVKSHEPQPIKADKKPTHLEIKAVLKKDAKIAKGIQKELS
jgi:hypothetical protein